MHGISLAVELRDNGYKNWEWFCKEFEDTSDVAKRAYPPAVEHFKSIRTQLRERILYRLYGDDGSLVEYPFDRLKE
jgi:hypothetical protein